MNYKAAFVINNRNKGPHVYKCVAGALAQTYPCHILVGDYASTDNSREQIRFAVNEYPRAADHRIDYIEYDEPTASNMSEFNKNFFALIQKTEAPWIFQCSSDDYSLPDRVKVCMEAVSDNKASAVATTMYFAKPDETVAEGAPVSVSGYPKYSGYVQASDGLIAMAYGSCIAGYHRKFLEMVGSAGPCTMDVFYGFLAALHHGYYAVCNPQHVHVMHNDAENIGFQGKMRAAELKGDMEEMTRINELNRFQLAQLYLNCALRQQHLFPIAKTADQLAVRQMFTDQCVGWLNEREKLHANKWMPGII